MTMGVMLRLMPKENGVTPKSKPCGKCGETKPLGDFPRARNVIDGRYSICRACKYQHNASWKKESRAVPRICKLDGCNRATPGAGWAVCSMHQTRKSRHGTYDWVPLGRNGKAPPGKCSVPGCDQTHAARGVCGYHYHVTRKYGLSAERFLALGDKCSICGAKGNGHKLRVDHDHATGAVRGLLCAGCNTTVGYLESDPGRARAAMAYLKKHKTLSNPVGLKAVR